MRIAYFDCFSGASGDMTLGALLDCGASQTHLRTSLALLPVGGYALDVQKVTREGITATDVHVHLTETDTGHGRHLSDISAILTGSDLPPIVKTNALAIFTRLADAEARIHGTSREDIHFHEVGAVDAIVDIVGACILLHFLGVKRVYTSPLPCGYGTITCQHGLMPVPAPATLELLKGFPVRAVDIKGELVTPTGAAIITTLAPPELAGTMPDMTVVAAGWGAGKKQFVPDMPNLLRIVLGDIPDATDSTLATVAVLEANLDDQSPETYDLLMSRAFDAGALDVFLTPTQMKKNRPGTLVTVLCPPAHAETLARVLFRDGGTFGVRVRQQSRYTLSRTWRTVATPYGDIRLKIGAWRGDTLNTAPEYEDCKRAALSHNVPLRDVYQAALRAA